MVSSTITNRLTTADVAYPWLVDVKKIPDAIRKLFASAFWPGLFLMAGIPLALMPAGCSLTGSKTPPPAPPAGIYKSIDRGDTWVTKNTVLNPNPPSLAYLNNTNVVSVIFDPTDRTTMYLGTQTQGLYYTYNNGESWFASSPIRSQAITSIAVPNYAPDRCSIYISASNKVYKSLDCGRHWDQIYTDSRNNVLVESIAVNEANDHIVFMGLSTGDILQSKDSGATWQIVARFNDDIRAIVPHSLNANILYVALKHQGMRKTTDGGATWVDISEGLKPYNGATNINDITWDPNRPETVILATNYGIVRTTDGGATWSAVPLLTPAGQVSIVSVALDPSAPTNLYYTTSTTLYRSSNAGNTWETKTLPVGGALTKLLVDPGQAGTIYMAVARPQQQQQSSFGL